MLKSPSSNASWSWKIRARFKPQPTEHLTSTPQNIQSSDAHTSKTQTGKRMCAQSHCHDLNTDPPRDHQFHLFCVKEHVPSHLTRKTPFFFVFFVSSRDALSYPRMYLLFLFLSIYLLSFVFLSRRYHSFFYLFRFHFGSRMKDGRKG